MRIKAIPPDQLNSEARAVHDEIARLVQHSQGQVNMLNADGALLGPFNAMLQQPQFGIPALSFLRTLDVHATLAKSLREIAILSVGGFYGARFELYAHEIMALEFGIPASVIAILASGGHPPQLNEEETLVHQIAHSLVSGRIVPDATYKLALRLFGKEGLAELYFLIAGYTLIAIILNGYDIPAPESSQV